MVIGIRYKFQIYSFKSAIFFLVSGKNKSEDDEFYEQSKMPFESLVFLLLLS